MGQAVRHEVATLTGDVVSFRTSTDDGWGVGELRTGDGNQTFTGKLVGARVGDSIEATGHFVDHPKYGRQFKLRTCTTIEPVTDDGVIKWLASRLPSVGLSRARALVERFGSQLWHAIEVSPASLTEVSGITMERALEIQTVYFERRAERDFMVKLRGWGLTDAQVARCITKWGELAQVVEIIATDPYVLCEVHGFGFLRSDSVALAMGTPFTAPSRLRAGVVHVLDQAVEDGHCYLAGAALQSIASKLLRVAPKEVVPGIHAAAARGDIIRRGWRIYVHRIDAAESKCSGALGRLLQAAAEHEPHHDVQHTSNLDDLLAHR
jgi:exodeoxyribonuclease V alpha subunit